MERQRIRSLHHRDFPAEQVARAKHGAVVTVCLPAKDEEATVGAIVSSIRTELVERCPVVDEILVVDDGSCDATARIAGDAGARVVSTAGLLPELGPGTGKGEALWKGVHAATGEIVVFCDADIVNFEPHFVLGLVGPLVTDPSLVFVKGFYERPDTHAPGTGGRNTELVARPLIALLFPELSELAQPLSGEYAARRQVLCSVPFVQDYGVDIGLLIDIANLHSVDAMAQVDLGVRVHRNWGLHQLSPQSVSIMQTAFVRAGLPTIGPASLVRPGYPPLRCQHVERAPLAEVATALRSA